VRFELPENERNLLRRLQRQEKYKRVYVKVTVLLMLDLGESPQKVALFLGLDDGTIYRYIENYQSDGLDRFLETNYHRYEGKLEGLQLESLRVELKSRLFETAREVCLWVKQEFGVSYTEQGMCDLLHRLGFVYKKTKQIPMKVDAAAQQAFLEKFQQLQANKTEDEVHYFIDAVHPTLNSEASYGWIEKGEEHQILSNSGRTRLNILGALNPHKVTEVITEECETINHEAAKKFFARLSAQNPEAKSIKIIIDNASYFKKLVEDGLIEDERIEVIWLPTYAPNLNLIERLWKFMKKKVMKNRFYGTAKGFREKVREFFDNITDYKNELESLLTCNFTVIEFSQSIS
jgi:transposase